MPSTTPRNGANSAGVGEPRVADALPEASGLRLGAFLENRAQHKRSDISRFSRGTICLRTISKFSGVEGNQGDFASRASTHLPARAIIQLYFFPASQSRTGIVESKRISSAGDTMLVFADRWKSLRTRYHVDRPHRILGVVESVPHSASAFTIMATFF